MVATKETESIQDRVSNIYAMKSMNVSIQDILLVFNVMKFLYMIDSVSCEMCGVFNWLLKMVETMESASIQDFIHDSDVNKLLQIKDDVNRRMCVVCSCFDVNHTAIRLLILNGY
jgi:hypothetical protein